LSGADLVIFGNVSQPPSCNNLYPPLRAFQKAFKTVLVEPAQVPGFVGTGDAKPALVPDDAVLAHADPPPDAVVCLSGGLHLSKHARRAFSRSTAFAGFALSDPYGLEASLAIAPEFDLFYTQDPQTLHDYAGRGIAAKRCDPATDPELYRPLKAAPECDILYYGKWTPYRNDLVTALAARFSVRVHAYTGDKRWSVPVRPPLETPDALRAALNGARLALETALVDDVHGKYRGTYRITPRVFFAASCGVPSLIESFPRLPEWFAPEVEIAVFPAKDEVVAAAAAILADEPARLAMGRRARQRALREHTWDRRIETFILDLAHWRKNPRSRQTR
jgi:spore maturation protein CgeB